MLYKNALIYDRSIVQISNICSVWVADQSYVVRHELPSWIKFVGGVGAVAALIVYSSKSWGMGLIGLAMVAAAFYGYRKHNPGTSVSKYALGVERSSGRVTLFTSSDHGFVMRAAQALLVVIAEGNTRTQKTVINFDNKQINIETAIGSNIFGEDAVDSLVEAVCWAARSTSEAARAPCLLAVRSRVAPWLPRARPAR